MIHQIVDGKYYVSHNGLICEISDEFSNLSDEIKQEVFKYVKRLMVCKEEIIAPD